LGPYEFVVRVTGLSERRGSAKHAAVLYEEDPTAKTLRLRLAEQLRVAPPPTFEGKGRPTKRDRREIDEISNWSGGPGADSDLDEPDSA
jgi:ribosome-associated heat shock protein Hsp15